MRSTLTLVGLFKIFLVLPISFRRWWVSGAPLTHHRRNETGGTKRILYSPTNLSVDRINPEGPYTRENIMLVCSTVNIMRRNMQIDEFVMWCRMIAEHERDCWD